MADEVRALDKHACPACGAQAEWNPVKQKLAAAKDIERQRKSIATAPNELTMGGFAAHR